MDPVEQQLIVIPGLEGNEPTVLTPLQEAFVPFIPLITDLWWTMWFTTIIFIVTQFVLLPLFRKNRR
jgi:hypothetical protein